MKKPFNRWVTLAVVTGIGFLADWGTKAWALSSIEPGTVQPAAGSWLAWTLTYNPGALFSLDPGRWIPDFPTSAFYMGFTVLGIVLMLWIYAKLDLAKYRMTRWGLAMVLPGALGNLLDRVLGRPGVVDFIKVDLGFPPFNPWPIFNVADIGISVGIGLIALDMLLADVRQQREKKAQAGRKG